MRRTLQASGRSYTIALDDERRAGHRLWAIVQARLIDEMTQRAVTTPIRVTCDREGLSERAALGGLAALVGVPARVFAFPDLALNAQDLEVTFQAAGYLPLELPLTIGPMAGFPDSFFPFNLGDIALHREPVTIRGRVVQGDGTAVSGLTIRIDALWLQLPSAIASPPPDPYHPLALQPPLRFARSAGVARLRRREMIDVAGEDKTLLAPVAADARRIRCSDRVNLAPGDLLVLDPADPAITEYVPITAIDGAGTADQPAMITLAYPLAYDHRAETLVRRTQPQAAGADNPFGVDAIAGDSTVLLDAVTDLAGALVAEIADGGQPNEYRRISPFATNSDGDGYFRLPPLSRVAQLNLRIFGGALSADIDEFVPDYGSREHWIDVRV